MGANDGDSTVHVFFRGDSHRLETVPALTDLDGIVSEKERYIWAAGVGETDEDPMFVFMDYELIAVYRPAHVHVVLCPSKGVAKEYRVFNIFSPDGEFRETISLDQTREMEDGEFME